LPTPKNFVTPLIPRLLFTTNPENPETLKQIFIGDLEKKETYVRKKMVSKIHDREIHPLSSTARIPSG
jgi:hypothetical protein